MSITGTQNPTEIEPLSLSESIDSIEKYVSHLLAEKKIPKYSHDQFLSILNQAKSAGLKIVEDLSVERSKVIKLQEKLLENLTHENQTPKTPVSFASVVATSSNPNPRKLSSAIEKVETPPSDNHILFLNPPSIQPKLANDELSVERNKIKQHFPACSKIKVKSMGPTKNGGILVSFDNNEDLVKGAKILTESTSINYTVAIPTKICPKMTLKNVPKSFAEDEDKRNKIITLNEWMEDTLENGKFEIMFSTDGKDEYHKNLVIKVSPCMRFEMKKRGQLYIPGGSVNISDRFFSKMCFACGRFGHYEKYCTHKDTKTCTICAGSHDRKDCPKSINGVIDDAHKTCLNCLRSNSKPLIDASKGHSCLDKSCPIYVKEQEKLIQRTDFGVYGY